MEQWHDVRGYERLYKVSSLGNVMSLDRKIYGRGRKKLSDIKGRILKQKTDRYGYKTVQLVNDGKRQHITVHRIVAIAFLHNPLNLPQVNHKDLNKQNNCIENLEWCTAKYNVNHAHNNGKKPNIERGKHGMAKIVIDLNTGIFYDCAKDAADAHGFSHYKMKDIMRGRNKSIKNFIYV